MNQSVLTHLIHVNTETKFLSPMSEVIFFLSSAGVLMWEVFTCGKMPYGRLKNTEVVERVQRGIVLERPKNCYKEIYEVSR